MYHRGICVRGFQSLNLPNVPFKHLDSTPFSRSLCDQWIIYIYICIYDRLDIIAFAVPSMKEVLKQHEEVFLQALEILCQFEIDSTQSPPGLFEKLSHILKPWPQLLHGFAPFLLPEQAQACGLVSICIIYCEHKCFTFAALRIVTFSICIYMYVCEKEIVCGYITVVKLGKFYFYNL